MSTATDLPSYFKPLFSAEQIAEANRRVGQEVTTWARSVWERSHTDIITVPILRGGIFFYADLVRQISCSVELATSTSKAYEVNENGVAAENVTVDISSVPAVGRSVLLVDDVCDSGRTLKTLSEKIKAAGALEVRTAVLVKRILEKQTFNPDWVGLEYQGPEWFVGYGMEDGSRWRNLPAIYIISK